MLDENVDNVVQKLDKIFKAWSRRSLSILGKVLIVKTFGIAQIIYLMQSLVLKCEHFKKINANLYKFIWNRHYLAAKAPERIKREIMCTPLKNGGFGMLDLACLDDGLKLRALARIVDTLHPMLAIARSRIEWGNFCNVRTKGTNEAIISKSIQLLNKDRLKIINNQLVLRSRSILSLLGDIDLKSCISNTGRVSLHYFRLRQLGVNKIRELSQAQFNSIERFMDRNWRSALRNAVSLNLPPDMTDKYLYCVGNKLKDMRALSSKVFRQARSTTEQQCVFKIGLILTPLESASWFLKISKLTNVRHRSLVLRIIHGDFYTREKLYRYNLAPDNECKICGEVETLTHKFVQCTYVKRINDVLRNIEGQRPPPHVEPEEEALGAWLTNDLTNITIRAEILQRISYLRESSYVMHPKALVKNVLETLRVKERNESIKENLEDLLAG